MKILKACRVNYDARTDIREQGEALGPNDVDWLQIGLDTGKVRIEPGLLGWPPYNATAFVDDLPGVFHVEVEGIEETGEADPAKRNAARDPKPAILTISCLFVTCPCCSHDLPIATPEGDTTDWSLSHLADFDGQTDPAHLPFCPHCGQKVTISLPKSLPVNP